MELWDYERQAWNSGAETVCGVDEAGAGPLMGPVYAAAVILPGELDIPGLNDSKKLTEKKREALYEVITTQAVSWSVTRVEALEIDEMAILTARPCSGPLRACPSDRIRLSSTATGTTAAGTPSRRPISSS